MHSPFYSSFKQSLQTDIDTQYSKLKLSMYSILEIVTKQYELIGIYDPKNNSLEVVDKEFDEFQLMLRNDESYIYYNSLIIIGFSIQESLLKRICYFIENKLDNSEKFIIENKNIFNQCVKYIDKNVTIIERKDFNRIKGEIERVNKLRNLIVHNNSNFIKKKNILLEKQDNYKILSECKYLTLMDTGQVFINNPEYIKSFVLNSKKLLDIIIRSLPS